MSMLLKKILFAVLGLMGIAILLFFALSYFLDPRFYKPWFEKVASQTLGMEVHIHGPMEISLFPDLHVRLIDMQIRKRGMDIASSEEVYLEIALTPLIHRKLQLKRIDLQGFQFSINQDSHGALNFEKQKEKKGPFHSLVIDDLSISNGNFLYKNEKSGEKFVVENYTLEVCNFLIKEWNRKKRLKDLSFTAEFTCHKIRTRSLLFSDVTFTCNGKEGLFSLNPIKTRLFDGQGSGRLEMDFSDPVPRYSVRASLLKFKIEDYLKTLSFDKVAEGEMDFSATLSMQGNSAKEMVQTVLGKISLVGEDLTLYGNNLDRAYVSFETNQNFHIVDAVTFFFAGPLGFAVTAGNKLASIFMESGKSHIQRLFSDWKIENGIAQAKDVAMSTKHNRMALKGRIDFVNKRFDDVTIALINAQGCARVEQKIHGPFGKPVVEKPNVLMSIAELTLNMIKKTRGIFTGENCEIFYEGSISAP